VAVDPDNAEAWNNLGVLYRRQSRDEAALDAFVEARTRAPDRPDIPFNIGNLHKSAGRYDEAITAYNRAIEIDPTFTPAYNNLGTLYESREQRDRALEVFRRGLANDSGDPSLRFNLGLVYQEEGQWEDAHSSFESALKSRPGWVPGLNNLGIVLQEMGREDEAARTFRNLLDIDPHNASAQNNLGVAYDRLGRTEEARRCFRKALDEDPRYVKAALNLHDSLRQGRELNEALEEVNKQITHHPENPEVRVRMARTLMGLTRWDEAEQALEHVLERQPDHVDALRTKADLMLATERPEEAERLLRSLPHDPDVIRDLARLNINTDRSETAERLLGELIAVDPDDDESRRLLSDLIADDRPEDAVKLREEALATTPDRPDDLVGLAELYGRIGRKSDALSRLDDAVNLLGARGEAEDLDAMSAVLGLYETAAEALEDEQGDLFAERTSQLGRKLMSAMGRSGMSDRQRRRSAFEEIPLDEEDALSLLDINAMEPVIRINEEEETVYLEESAEDLDDAYTELKERERLAEEAAPFRPAAGPAGGAPQGGEGGPPVHIHLPSQSMPAPSPQVIYQDLRPVSSPPAAAPQTPPVPQDVVSVESMSDEALPELPESEEETPEIPLELEAFDTETTLEIVETDETVDEGAPEEVAEIAEDDEEEDDDGFFIPDSDALSEELPAEAEPAETPDADLVFPADGGAEGGISELGAVEEELVLEEAFEPASSPPIEDELPEEPEEDDSMDPSKMAEMFKYLSELTEETSGEGRQRLIDDGVPLKLAGLSARLSGEPRFREVAQKFDRRRRERHNVELNEDRIRGSLNAFKSLADAYPSETVRESLARKLGRIMSLVDHKDSEEPES